MKPDTAARFQTTRKTLLHRLQHEDDSVRQPALAELTRLYWPAIYGHLRRRGVGQDQAAELTQDFFTNVVLSRELFRRYGSSGRLRSLLLQALKNYRIDRHRRSVARGKSITFSRQALEHEEDFLSQEPVDDADVLFQHRWLVAVLEEAMQRCEQYYTSRNLQRYWQAFQQQEVQPTISNLKRRTQREVAAELGFDSAAQVADALRKVRQRLRSYLREVIGETVSSTAEAEEEYNALRSMVNNADCIP